MHVHVMSCMPCHACHVHVMHVHVMHVRASRFVAGCALPCTAPRATGPLRAHPAALRPANQPSLRKGGGQGESSTVPQSSTVDEPLLSPPPSPGPKLPV